MSTISILLFTLSRYVTYRPPKFFSFNSCYCNHAIKSFVPLLCSLPCRLQSNQPVSNTAAHDEPTKLRASLQSPEFLLQISIPLLSSHFGISPTVESGLFANRACLESSFPTLQSLQDASCPRGPRRGLSSEGIRSP